jgi:hypothetical protein
MDCNSDATLAALVNPNGIRLSYFYDFSMFLTIVSA